MASFSQGISGAQTVPTNWPQTEGKGPVFCTPVPVSCWSLAQDGPIWSRVILQRKDQLQAVGGPHLQDAQVCRLSVNTSLGKAPMASSSQLPPLHKGVQGESAAAMKGSSWGSCVLGGNITEFSTFQDTGYLMTSPKGQEKFFPTDQQFQRGKGQSLGGRG